METINEADASSTNTKIPRIRSVAYPSNTISHCVNLTEKIYKIFGSSTYVPREKISKETDIGDSHLQTQLSSCVQYGLLELKSKEGYRSTGLFTKIYKPLPSENKNDALLLAFKSPELYKKIIKEHNGDHLPLNGLATILFRNYKVSEAASIPAAKIFLENAKALNLIDKDNQFNIDILITPTEEINIVEEKPLENSIKNPPEISYLPPTTMDNSNTQQKKFDFPPIPIFLEKGVAELYLPNGFNKDDIKRVLKVLKAYVEE